MKILREFYESENVKLLENYFYTKDTINDLKKYNKTHLFNRYDKKQIKDLEEFKVMLVKQFNENNEYIYNNSNDKKVISR